MENRETKSHGNFIVKVLENSMKGNIRCHIVGQLMTLWLHLLAYCLFCNSGYSFINFMFYYNHVAIGVR